MHTVIASECTGCELCIAPCPVDCITMALAVAPPPERANHWRARHRFHLFRVERDKRERAERLKAKALAKLDDAQFQAPDKQAKIQAALDRAAARQRASTAEPSTPPESAVDPKVLARQEKLREILARAAARRGPPPEERDHED
jgi:electron transport complex protein RnfB